MTTNPLFKKRCQVDELIEDCLMWLRNPEEVELLARYRFDLKCLREKRKEINQKLKERQV